MVSPPSWSRTPDQLHLVVDLLNSVDLRRYGHFVLTPERDEFANGERLRRWLHARDLLAHDQPVTEHDLRWVKAVRDELRSILRRDDSPAPLRFTGSEVALILTFDGTGSPRLVSTETGARGAIASLLVEIEKAAASGTWSRLKICGADDCQRAFVDGSRNGMARWCSMKICGNRVKTRAYRRRRTGRAATTSPPRTAPKVAGSGRSRTAVFMQEGDYWSIRYGGRTFRLKDAKGLQHLATLMRHPGREFHVLDLTSSMTGAPKGLLEPDASIGVGGLREPVLDAEAKVSYMNRLQELRDQLKEGEDWGDPERAARARAEIESLTQELARATGLLGRDRMLPTEAERARVNVTRVIKAAMDRIAACSPELRHHLGSTVRTGTYCSYDPDPRLPTDWQL